VTLVDVISLFDNTRPNSFDFETKRKWVLSLESEIREFVCLHSEKNPDMKFWDEENPKLILDSSNTDLYLFYLVSMGDLTNAEYRLYNMSSTYFNSVFMEWKRHFRAHNCPCKNTDIKV